MEIEKQTVVDRVVVCDDGSDDETGRIAQRLGAVVLKHDRNYGKGRALKTLFEYARQSGADAVVTLDSDLQHDPADIPRLLAGLSKNDMVVGERDYEQVPLKRKLGLWPFDKMVGEKDSQSGFRAYGPKAIKVVNPTEDNYVADSQILLQVKDAGLTIGKEKIGVSYEGETSQANGWVHTTDVFTGIIQHFVLKRPFTVFGTAGFAAIAASIYFGLRSFIVYQSSNPSLQYQILLGLVSTYFLVIGGVLLTVGLVLFLSPRHIPPPPKSAQLPQLGMALVVSGFFTDALRAFLAVHIGVVLMTLFFLGFFVSARSLVGKVPMTYLFVLAAVYYVSQYEYITAQAFPVISITALGMLATPFLALWKR